MPGKSLNSRNRLFLCSALLKSSHGIGKNRLIKNEKIDRMNLNNWQKNTPHFFNERYFLILKRSGKFYGKKLFFNSLKCKKISLYILRMHDPNLYGIWNRILRYQNQITTTSGTTEFPSQSFVFVAI